MKTPTAFVTLLMLFLIASIYADRSSITNGQSVSLAVIDPPHAFSSTTDLQTRYQNQGNIPKIEVVGTWRTDRVTFCVRDAKYRDGVKEAIARIMDAIETFTERWGYSYLRRLRLEYSEYECMIPVIVEDGAAEPGYAGTAYWELEWASIGWWVVGGHIGIEPEYFDVGVVIHEVVHMLGIGHTDPLYPNCGEDGICAIMSYSHPRDISTVDVYGLAVAYRWLQSGTPSPPRWDTYLLPRDIPYRSVWNVKVILEPVIDGQYHYMLRGFLERTVRGLSRPFEAKWLRYGSTLDLEFMNYTSSELKILFRKVEGFEGNRLHLELRNDLSLKVHYDVYYSVIIHSAIKVTLERTWYRHGEMLSLSIPKEVVFNEGRSKALLKGVTVDTWYAYELINGTDITLRVLSPVRIRVFWDVWHLIRIRDEGLTREEWIYNGTVIDLSPPAFVYLGDERRLRLVGWQVNGRFVRVQNISVTVTEPLDLRGVRVTENRLYLLSEATVRVLVRAPELGESLTVDVKGHTAIWAVSGSRVELIVPATVELRPGSRLRFAGITVNGLHLSGTEFLAESPLKVEVRWVRQHLVSKVGIGEFAGLGWVDEGKVIEVRPVQEVMIFPNSTRLVFQTMDGFGKSAVVEVTGPTVIVSGLSRPQTAEIPEGFKILLAVWRREYLVLLRALNAQGEEVKATIKLAEIGREVEAPAELWLPEGTLNPPLANWMGRELRAMMPLDVKGPGEVSATLPIYRVWTVVRDWFGLPTPMLGLRTEFGEEVTVPLTSTVRLTLAEGPNRIGIVIPQLGVRIYELEVNMPREGAGVITVVMPTGTISAALMAGATLVTVFGLRVARASRRSQE